LRLNKPASVTFDLQSCDDVALSD